VSRTVLLEPDGALATMRLAREHGNAINGPLADDLLQACGEAREDPAVRDAPARKKTVIEAFPSGGGGYVVATKRLGFGPGLVAGSALLIDYVLTITISIAAGTDAIFSFLPQAWHGFEVHSLKVTFAAVSIAGLMLLNLRGVKESILTLMPIFLVFLAMVRAIEWASTILTITGILGDVGRWQPGSGVVGQHLLEQRGDLL